MNIENILKKPSIKIEECKYIAIEFFQKFITRKAPDADIIILITKKSYWTYYVLQEELCESTNENEGNKTIWYSDRYFQKLMDFTEFDGKKIVIIDDTMNSGIAIREFYKMMLHNCPNSVIIPIVCMLNEQYDEDEHIFDEEDKRFHDNLQVMYETSPTEIGSMCVFETMIFHDKLVSYIIDLPIFEIKESDGLWTRKITMPIQKFKELCKGDYFWNYIPNDYTLVPGKEVKSGFFTLYNPSVNSKLNNFLLNMVVKVQYEENIDDQLIVAVFTPFSIMGSVKADELELCFDKLFSDTDYKKIIHEKYKPELQLNYYTAIYRGVVYCLSMYIGIKFIDFIKLGAELRLYNDKHFDNVFYESIEKIFPQKDNYSKFNEVKFLTSIKYNQGFTKIKTVNSDIINNAAINYEQQEWFPFLYEKIIKNKRSKKQNKSFLSEELEELMLNNLEEYKQNSVNMITKAILESLNKSILSNYITYNNQTKTIFRGYRYGENSDLLLPYDARIFYKGILTYYENVGKQKYYNTFELFIFLFKNYLKRNGIYDYLISERQFKFFVRYFNNIPSDQLETQIENKKFLLNNNFCKIDNRLSLILFGIENYFKQITIV